MQKLMGLVRRCVDDYNMINEGDRIAVGVSGGKDSIALVCAMANLTKFYPKKFELEVITMDPGFYKAGFGNEEETKKSFSTKDTFMKVAFLDAKYTEEKIDVQDLAEVTSAERSYKGKPYGFDGGGDPGRSRTQGRHAGRQMI